MNSLSFDLVDEEKSRSKSLMYTSVLALLVYTALYLIPIPFEAEEKERYKTIGIIPYEETEQIAGLGGIPNAAPGPNDYGNGVEGSGNINNFDDPAENTENGDGAKQAAKPAQVVTTPDRFITQAAPSRTKVKPRQRVKRPNTTRKANTTGNGRNNRGGTPGRSGSNHGNRSSGAGNMGSPYGNTLDSRGLFGGGGSGFDGLDGRGVIRADKPNPSFSSDGKVKYKVVIAPDGSVVAFTPINGLTPGLRQPSRDAAAHVKRNWKFEPVDRSMGNQTCYYTISYRLS